MQSALLSTDLLQNFHAVIQAVKSAGNMLCDRFTTLREKVEYKDRKNIRTEADLQAEKIIVDALKQIFPQDSIYGEESGLYFAKDAKGVWFVDALDGTTNFVSRLPVFATQCAYVAHGEIHAAVIYVPTTDECFTAIAGQNAYCNDIQLHVAEPDNNNPKNAVVVLSRAAREEEVARHVRIYAHIATEVVRTCRVINSAAGDFVRVAQGGFHASIHNGANLYDVLPGILLVREAGGITTDFLDNTLCLPYTDCEDEGSLKILLEGIRADTICSAPLLHTVLQKHLAQFAH